MRKFCYLLLLLGLVMTQSVKADKTAKAIWTADNTTLTFVYDGATYNVGDAYGTGTVTNVWDPTVLTTPDIDTETWETFSGVQIPGWIEYDPVYSGTGTAGVDFAYNSFNPFKTKISNVTKVVFDASFASVRPTSLALWFFICKNLSDFEGLEYLNTSSATDMRDLFYHCDVISSAELDLTHFDTSNVTNMLSMFTGCYGLTSLNLLSFNFDNVTNMRSFVQSCNNLYEITFPAGLNTGNVTDMESAFRECAFETLIFPEGFDTHNVVTMQRMFYGNSKLKTLTIPTTFVSENVTNMAYMFSGCSALTSLNLSGFNTENVTTMSAMFNGCSALTNLNLSGFNTENVTAMNSMFNGCSALTSLNLSGFNTENVTTMNSMFYGCSALTSLNLSGFNTENVTAMNSMFRGCSALTSLNLSGFNTENVTTMSGMFNECKSLQTITFSSKITTSKVNNMLEMFRYCEKLVELDLSTFDTRNVTKMDRMFSTCSELKAIIVSKGWNTDAVTSSTNMFLACSKLIGGNGTTYNASYKDKTYAHVDEEGNPGYLTLGVNAWPVYITEAGMATFCSDKALTVPTGVEAWYCRSINDESSLVFAYPITTTIPANTGVFLTGNQGNYFFEEAADVPAIANNIMVGTLTDTAVDPKSVLTLGHDQDGKLGFWYFTGTTIPAGRAYIPKSAVSTDAAAEARAYTVVFDESGESQTTGINNVNVNHNVDCYDLLGRRVAQPQKGLYIVNGKKVVIK